MLMTKDSATHVKILTLDLDSSSLRELRPVVVEMGLEMLTAHDLTDALAQIEAQEPDVLLLDLASQEAQHYPIIGQMREGARQIPVIFLARNMEAAPALDGRPTATITRPIVPDDLKAVIGRVTQGPDPAGDPPDARNGQVSELGDYGTLLCHSAAMRDVMNMVDQVASTNITVLVRGESGTGKELVSRTLYQRSRRKDKPFVKVLCAALPEGLLESELFGYERGAFTGAHRRKPGKFEFANQGTIFLDEIGEVPITLQAKLLQVLQDGEFVRLGGEQDVRVDVRVIAATNRDLEQSVKAGTFREDLFYRLNVVSITIPPLRDRMEEIPFLCDFFIEKFRLQYQRDFPRLSEATMAGFMNYRWPGNVRELENMIKQIVVLGDERAVLQKFEQFRASGGPAATEGAPARPFGRTAPPPWADEMPEGPGAGPAAAQPAAPPASVPAPPPVAPAPESPFGPEAQMNLLTTIERGIAEGHLPLKEIGKHAAGIAEREAILRVLNYTRWNRRRAAQILDISYKALLYKIRDYGLNNP
jgi:two-component system response regulator AtoC